MFHPPPDTVIERLRTGVVYSIYFGKYILHIGLESGDQISIEAPFRFGNGDSLSDSPIEEFPIQSTNLVRLLGEGIVGAKCAADGTLEIQFSNGDHLIVYANDRPYEAYTLLVDGQEYVV
jgi:uncharacterized protein DUF6188